MNVLKSDKRYLLAFSGGPDSLAVFHLLRNGGFQFDCIHINHGLSENALKWQQNCMDICKEFKIQCLCFSVVVDKNASSIEQDAREKRYGVISKVFNDYGAWDAVLTGHHKNDNIETAFFNILRGGELSSMDGIKQTDTIFGFKIIRPALRFTRMELTEYLASIGCTNWNEDESNFDVAYSRNFLRHQIIPQLKTHFSGFDQSMLNFISRAQMANEYKQRFLDSFFEGNVTDFNTLYEYYNDTSSEGVVLQDIAISVVNFGATKMSKAFLTRAQLIDLCRRLFTIKDGKTKKVNSFYVDDTFVCNRGYNNSDSRNMVLSFHEVNPERNKEGHR